MKTFVLPLLLVSTAAFSEAPAPVQSYDMTLALANQLATATLDTCKKLEKKGVVAVVDRGGNLVTVMREDNVGPHNTLAAQRKAYTALSTKMPTRQLSKNAQSNPESANLNTVHELLLLGGGVPVVYKNQVIGAVGVAGMGGAEFDEKCAIEAIEKNIAK